VLRQVVAVFVTLLPVRYQYVFTDKPHMLLHTSICLHDRSHFYRFCMLVDGIGVTIISALLYIEKLET
jgi:hypothetical protein